MNNLYRLSRYLRPYGSRMIAAIAAMFGVAIATVGIISLLEPILDGTFLQPSEVIEGLTVDGVPQATNVTTEDLLRLAGSLVILYVLLGIARFLSAYLMGSVAFRWCVTCAAICFGIWSYFRSTSTLNTRPEG